jgi:hypothetical protein
MYLSLPEATAQDSDEKYYKEIIGIKADLQHILLLHCTAG